MWRHSRFHPGTVHVRIMPSCFESKKGIMNAELCGAVLLFVWVFFSCVWVAFEIEHVCCHLVFLRLGIPAWCSSINDILKWDDKDIRTTESKNVSNRVFWQEIPESFKWQVPQDGIAAMGSVILALSLAPWQNRTVPDKDLQGWRQTSSDFSNSNGAVWYPDLKFVEDTGALGERECCADNRWRLVGRILKIERF